MATGLIEVRWKRVCVCVQRVEIGSALKWYDYTIGIIGEHKKNHTVRGDGDARWDRMTPHRGVKFFFTEAHGLSNSTPGARFHISSNYFSIHTQQHRTTNNNAHCGGRKKVIDIRCHYWIHSMRPCPANWKTRAFMVIFSAVKPHIPDWYDGHIIIV